MSAVEPDTFRELTDAPWRIRVDMMSRLPLCAAVLMGVTLI